MESARADCVIEISLLLLFLQLLLLEEESALSLNALVLCDLIIFGVRTLAKLLKPHSKILGGSHDLLELVRN